MRAQLLSSRSCYSLRESFRDSLLVVAVVWGAVLFKEEFGVWNPRFQCREEGGFTVSFNDIWMKSKYKRV